MAFRMMAALGVSAAVLVGMGCRTTGFMSGRPEAVCQLAPLEGGTVNGKVTFTQQAEGLLIEAEFEGLKPGRHGIHIHEHGDCGGVAAAAAGPHFNPVQRPHGTGVSAESHVGDLGNIIADVNGRAQLSIKDRLLQLYGDKGILGRSIVMHADEDDLLSQPAGNSGARIACGVIRAAGR